MYKTFWQLLKENFSSGGNFRKQGRCNLQRLKKKRKQECDTLKYILWVQSMGKKKRKKIKAG